jgi:ACS family glucarate transporter-like MFS transporter
MGDPAPRWETRDEPPTAVRHGVLAFTAAMAVLLYLDRVCISVAGGAIAGDLGLDKLELGAVFSAFFLAYALGQVPAGWLGDRLGARVALPACVLAWSLCTALTGLVGGLAALIAVRLLFGLAQAGAYPIAARVNGVWAPFSQRAFTSGVISLGGRAGGALAPVLTASLILALGGWRPAFWLFALPGIVWAACFWLWFRDSPAEHPGCNEAEARLIAARPGGAEAAPRAAAGAIPWSAACGSVSMWMQCLAQFTTNIAWAFLITWLPTYLEEAHKLDLKESGWLASVPLLVGMAGCALGGVLTDRLTARLGLKWGRNLPGMLTKFLAAAGPLAALATGNPLLAVAALALTSFGVDLGLGATWAYFQDAGGPYVGTLLGWANMFGNLGAFASPLLMGWLGGRYGWSPALAACSALYVASGLCWLGIDARVPVVRGENEKGPP